MPRESLKNVCRLIDVANTDVTPEQSFLADLKRSIELQNMENYKKPSQYYKPSSMRCLRNMYYQRIGMDVDDTHASYCSVGITSSGSDTHVRIQSAVEYMKKCGMDCEYIDVADFVKNRHLDYLDIVSKSGMETKLFHKDLNMSFLCDGIILYKGHYYILEIKTETGFKWNNRTDVDPSHYAQGTAYSIALGLPEIIFVYISRDVLDMKAFMFVPANEQKEELIGKIEECEGYVERLICPPKPEDLPKKVCEYCNYRQQCRKDG